MARLVSLLLVATLLFAACASARLLGRSATTKGAAPLPPRRRHRHVHAPIPASRLQDPATPSTANCTVKFYTQKLDHYTQDVNAQTYKQRVFLCKPDDSKWTPNSTIFFYTGNEANVELFVNMTGLMWENAAKFNATLVFAEHRYFGKSLPFPGEDMPTPDKLKYLTADQALEDYAALVRMLKLEWNSQDSPVIAFGGSYGGMLASWFRIKFPGTVDGSIAGSAPIVNFEDVFPAYNPNAFNDVVTFDATAEGGAKANCADNVRQSWIDIQTLGNTAEGLQNLSSIFKTCTPLETTNDIWNLINYASQCFGNMAMSSYPYPSSYLLLGGNGVLPAYPMRVACDFMGDNFTSPEERLKGFVKMILVYYNATGDFTCLNPNSTVNHATEVVDYLWGYMSCATMLMPFGQDGKTDMFWPAPWNLTAGIEGCVQQYGIQPAVSWPQVQYGGWGVSKWGSNIVFSNGGLDPWRPGGITEAHTDRIKTVIIPDMGHHIDLMFSDPKDTDAIKDARRVEVEHIAKWIEEKRKALQ
jgi:lysosomal Pro-X carboxypeptidase